MWLLAVWPSGVLASEDAARWPFGRARVHLLFGERLRRMRAVTDARAFTSARPSTSSGGSAPRHGRTVLPRLRATGQARQRGERIYLNESR